MVVHIDTERIADWESFHTVFIEAFGFLDGYGRNMDAWIDCMSTLDDEPGTSLSTFHCPVGEVVVLHLEQADALALRVPLIFQQILDCAAVVNWRRIEGGQKAILALSYYK
ncbi:barstar family protein [Hymenobacter sp. BT523]|uniref:barstar family protein n=1 Tax=Hymenobacter sp. BT523 TaxID=2795725 RepID=UPI0018EE3373|nr:barstar family protein [Hymenobacter sp. BT523]MBJ6110080.1 barstar family protein [Hymenobacter sp. BT523]